MEDFVRSRLMFISIAVIVVVIAAYILVARAFNVPLTYMFGIGPTKVYDTVNEPRPTTMKERKVADPALLIQRKSNEPQPVYTLILATSDELTQDNDLLLVKGTFFADNKQVPWNIKIRGRNGSYEIGYHDGPGLRSSPESIETVAFDELKSQIPANTLVQVKVATAGLDPSKVEEVIALLENASRGKYPSKPPTIDAFVLEIVKK